MIPESYLMHHGVKGMKWGISNSKYYKAVGTPAGTNAKSQAVQNRLSRIAANRSISTTSSTKNTNPYTGNGSSITISRTSTRKKPETIGSYNNRTKLLDSSRGYTDQTNPYKKYAENSRFGKTGSDYEGYTYYDNYGNPIYWEEIHIDELGEPYSQYYLTEKGYELYGGKSYSNFGRDILNATTAQIKINNEIINNAKNRIKESANLGITLETGFETAKKILASPFNALANSTSGVINNIFKSLRNLID